MTPTPEAHSLIMAIVQNVRAVEAVVAIVIGLLSLWVMWRVGYTRATEHMAGKWKGLYEMEKAGNVAIKAEFDKCKAEWQKTLDRLNDDVKESREAHKQLLELNRRLMEDLKNMKETVAESDARIDALETELEETVKRLVRSK